MGHRRGKIGNEGSFQEDHIAEYSFSGEPEEGVFYVLGRWASTAECMEAAEEGEHRVVLKYSARGVNLVMAAPRSESCEIVVRQDGSPLTPRQASTDVRFRIENGREQSYIPVASPRMYALVDNPDFGAHTLELICPAGLAAFAFTFTSCVDPALTATSASVTAQT
jgi:hypothetical protein